MRTQSVKPPKLGSKIQSSSTMPTEGFKTGNPTTTNSQHFYELMNIQPTLPAEIGTLRAFSNSRLESISECPTFGVIHMQRQYPQHARAMALEAGEAMHQYFAAMRCWQLHKLQGLPEHAQLTGERIFGADRWADVWKRTLKQSGDIEQLGQLAVEVLNTSGYYDDPKDTTRTLSNMQTAAVVYAKETYPYLHAWPVWVADVKSPLKPVGVEQVFDVVLEYTDGKRVRFIGTLDGILCNASKNMRVTMAENKTA